MKLKNMWRLSPILLVLFVIVFFELKGNRERKKLYKTELHSKVIKVKSNWTGGRSVDYITANGTIITRPNTDTLFIGDSISKEANSGEISVYRNTHSHYELLRK